MHFGRLPDITDVDFRLPDNTPRTRAFLDLAHRGGTKMYVGCPVWSEPHWLDGFYPKGLKRSDFLRYYATRFNTVEVNSTFYQRLAPSRIQEWALSVPDTFRFCPKVYRGVTEGLSDTKMPELLKGFTESIRAFGSTLGLIYAQLPEHIGPQQVPAVAKFLDLWPEDLPLSLEFRHPGWFHAHSLPDAIINGLYRRRVATVIADTSGRRDALHMSLTQPRVLVRFLGNLGHESDERRLREWGARFKEWEASGLEELYMFLHQPEPGAIPETASAFKALLAGQAYTTRPKYQDMLLF